MFLKKIDPARAMEVVKGLRGAAGAGAGAAGAGGAAAAPSGEPTSGEAFAVIADHLERNGDLASQIGKTYLFRLSGPDSAWMVDLKNGKGAVAASTADAKADCTLDMSDQDFREMVAGKADAQKLYFGGKLKIGGDVMASQKLMFLKKIDPARAIEVVKKARGAGGGTPAAAPAAASTGTGTGTTKSAQAPAVMKALGERLAKTGLAKEVGAVVQLLVTSPDAAYLLDLKTGAGSVTEGKGAADVTLKLADEDLAALAQGETVRDLFQRGRVRIDGDMKVAPKLNFWKGLV
jgi:3-hydroxyacyl-CoA dehydrogenase/3a,7a,12a-trihydroxy-5b-cholest-24-enoyl-CoA hydratase